MPLMGFVGDNCWGRGYLCGAVAGGGGDAVSASVTTADHNNLLALSTDVRAVLELAVQ